MSAQRRSSALTLAGDSHGCRGGKLSGSPYRALASGQDARKTDTNLIAYKSTNREGNLTSIGLGCPIDLG